VEGVREIVRKDVEVLYRECQEFAASRIERMTAELLNELSSRSKENGAI
jgi:predicted RNA-binding protein with PIN domain